MGRRPQMAARAAGAVLLSVVLSVVSVVVLWDLWDSDDASIGVLALAAVVPPPACLVLVRPSMGAWFGWTITAAWLVNALMLLALLAAIASDGT